MAWTDDVIVTGRLRLRTTRPADWPVVSAMLTSPEVRRYLGGPVSSEVLDAVRDTTPGERWGVFCVADADTDEMIGICSFDRGRGDLEVSYQLRPDHWGAGLGSEAVAAALGWAWEHCDDDSVIAVTQQANAPSLALLRSLGFADDDSFVEFGEPQAQLRLHRQGAAAKSPT